MSYCGWLPQVVQCAVLGPHRGDQSCWHQFSSRPSALHPNVRPLTLAIGIASFCWLKLLLERKPAQFVACPAPRTAPAPCSCRASASAWPRARRRRHCVAPPHAERPAGQQAWSGLGRQHRWRRPAATFGRTHTPGVSASGPETRPGAAGSSGAHWPPHEAMSAGAAAAAATGHGCGGVLQCPPLCRLLLDHCS